MEKRISICIPSYNRPGLLKKTLDSIGSQTMVPFEVIVVDDCSAEDMAEIERECQRRNFQFIKNERNLGLMKNFNNAILKAKGDFVCLVHNDDMISRRFVEEIQKMITRYPNFNIYTTNCIGIDEDDNPIAQFRLFGKDRVIPKQEGLGWLWRRNYFTFFSVLGCTIYNRVFIQNNLFDLNWGNEADLDKSLKFMQEQDIIYVNVPIYFTRLHKDQESNRIKIHKEDLVKFIKNRLDIYDKYDFGIKNYLEKIKAVHVAQLLFRKKYSLKETMRVLGIQSVYEMIRIAAFLPVLFASEYIWKKISFLFHKKEIKKYL